MSILTNYDNKIFEQIIRDLGFLHDYNYANTAYQKESSRVGHEYLVKYSNKDKDIRITVSFSELDAFIFIEHEGKRHDVGGFMRNQLGQEGCFYNDKGENLTNFINESLSVFKKVATHELSELIKGNEWIDTPIDWADYK